MCRQFSQARGIGFSNSLASIAAIIMHISLVGLQHTARILIFLITFYANKYKKDPSSLYGEAYCRWEWREKHL